MKKKFESPVALLAACSFVSFSLLIVVSFAATGPVRVVSWAASPHGPYPSGNAVAQPDLQYVLPGGVAEDQTFRLVVKPDVFGRFARLRFSNALGSQPLSLDGVYVGLHASAGSLVPGTNLPVSFNGGKTGITVGPGAMVYSDPVDLDFGGQNLTGRNGGQFSRGRPFRTHDLACQGHDYLLFRCTTQRLAWLRRRQPGLSLHHNLLVFSGLHRCDGAVRRTGDRCLWGFDYRRHQLHH